MTPSTIQNLPGSTEFNVDAATITTFDVAYIKSKPDPVQGLWAGSYDFPGTPITPAARVTLARTLVLQGFTQLDLYIDVLGSDPYLTMLARQNEGITSVGTWQPNLASPSAGTLIVSTNPKDFPAFDPPPTPVPVDTSFIGAFAFMGSDGSPRYYVTMYALKAGVQNGMQHFEGGKNYQYEQTSFLVGTTSFWKQL